MFGKSFTFGRLFGIPLRVHWSFVLLLVLFSVLYYNIGGVEGIVHGIFFVLALFGCVVLHELGHSLTARKFGIGTRHITLLMIGGVAALERTPKRWTHELWIALAGPAVNVVICLLLLPTTLAFWEVRGGPGTTAADAFIARLWLANAVMAGFNLLPIFPMDGGRVLRALLSSKGNSVRATQIAVRFGQVAAIFLGTFGMFVNPILVVLAIFIFLAAESERKSVMIETQLEGINVGDVMSTEFNAVAPAWPAHLALGQLSRNGQISVPVLEEGRFLGMLDSEALGTVKGDPTISAGELTNPRPVVVSPEDALITTLEKFSQSSRHTLPVVDADGRLLGLLQSDAVNLVLSFGGKALRRPLGPGPSASLRVARPAEA